MKQATYSEIDNRGYLSVDCTECQRGRNGDKSCTSGYRILKGHQGSCFNGESLKGLEVK